ncbi:hypothetical protein MTO96_024693 [Rhipicephalus appendiculatus]
MVSAVVSMVMMETGQPYKAEPSEATQTRVAQCCQGQELLRLERNAARYQQQQQSGQRLWIVLEVHGDVTWF